MQPGVYIDTKKNGDPNYRASVTINKKHISLGSYPSEKEASLAYSDALRIYADRNISISDYSGSYTLSFKKFVVLINLRDNNIYFSTPIYVGKREFKYCLSPSEILTFDIDDLFYLSTKSIMKRGNHYFLSDYGMQVSLRERFGIMSFSVPGRDFVFINGDSFDFRRENIMIINRYRGVRKVDDIRKTRYKAIIHVKSDFVVGSYPTEKEAAIAYNKAADVLIKNGINKDFSMNYLDNISNKEYADIYSKVKISEKIYKITPSI